MFSITWRLHLQNRERSLTRLIWLNEIGNNSICKYFAMVFRFYRMIWCISKKLPVAVAPVFPPERIYYDYFECCIYIYISIWIIDHNVMTKSYDKNGILIILPFPFFPRLRLPFPLAAAVATIRYRKFFRLSVLQYYSEDNVHKWHYLITLILIELSMDHTR